MRNKRVNKLFADYRRAEAALIVERDKLFPPGTRVRSRLTNTEAIVKGGSLYPHQVFTTELHMGWHDLEKITDIEDQAGS